MKRVTIAMVMIIGLTFFASEGFGFFDQIFKPPPKKQDSQKSQAQDRQQEQPNLIDGLGGIFGVKKKDLDLLKKAWALSKRFNPLAKKKKLRWAKPWPSKRLADLEGNIVANVSRVT